MSKQREVRVIHRAQDAFGLLGARQVEAAVHRAHHEVSRASTESGRSRLPSSRMSTRSFEQRDAVKLRVEAVNLVTLPRRCSGSSHAPR